MKLPIVFLMCLLLPCCANAQSWSERTTSDKKTLATENLKGKVKSVEETEYNIYSPNDTQVTFYSNYKFDVMGNFIYYKYIEFSEGKISDTSDIGESFFEFDSINNIILYNSYYTIDKDTRKDKTTNIYDSKGRVIKKTFISIISGKEVWCTYSYYKKGNINITTANADDGKVVSIYKNGNKIEEKIYNKDGGIDSKEISQYDKNNNRTKYVSYNKDGSVDSKIISKYDARNNKTENIVYKGYSMVSKEIFKYNMKNQKIEREWYDPKNKLCDKELYKYNDKGDLTEDNVFDKSGDYLKGSFSYDYDQNGNFVKMVEFYEDRNGSDISIGTTVTKREIAYY